MTRPPYGCKEDYKGKHYWENIGATSESETPNWYQLFRCSQCDLAELEKLTFV